jgi:hypothetical protein
MSDHPKLVVLNSGGTLVNEILLSQSCIVHGIHITHSSGSAGVIQVHDSATIPAEGAVPMQAHQISANSDADTTLGLPPILFLNGVYVCESDTIATKTLTTPEDLFIFIVIEEKTYTDASDN